MDHKHNHSEGLENCLVCENDRLTKENEALKAENTELRNSLGYDMLELIDFHMKEEIKANERNAKLHTERDRLRDLVEEAYAEGWGDNQPSANVSPMNNMDDMWTGSDSLEALNHKEVKSK